MPNWIGVFKGRKSIAAFSHSGSGLVAGLLKSEGERGRLIDVGGSMDVAPLPENLSKPGFYWVALRFSAPGKFEVVYRHQLRAAEDTDRLVRNHETYLARFRILSAVKRFFLDHEFVEVDTPAQVACPGMEPYLDSFPVKDGWLRTSPELHMKRLLAAGFDRIFQIGPCFRAGDHGSQHREEFQMLEWYRAFADLDDICDDIQKLLRDLSDWAVDPVYFRHPPRRVTCRDLFLQHLDLELNDCENREPLIAKAREKGLNAGDEDDWDTLYFLLFLNFIEPHLGADRATIVTDYPASQAALAVKAPPQPGKMPTCYRFELYIKGIEIANAFYELTDAEEQRTRFEADRAARRNLDKAVYEVDEKFMEALQSGMPPSAGIALGVDRLVLALLGKKNLSETLPFP